MKKLMVSLIMSAALAATLFTACTQEQGSQSQPLYDYLTTTQSVYGFSAASSAMVISDMSSAYAQKASALVERQEEQSTDGSTENMPEATPEQGTEQAPEQGTEQTPEQGTEQAPEQATELDGYLTLVGSLLSDGGFAMISQTSDRAEYTEKMIVSCRDISGNQVSYIMYYNQLLTESEEDEGEIEETYSIEGVMIVDGAEYAIRGERENETEGDESEAETSFRVTLGENSYMLVEQSFEQERDEVEQEFTYKVYENGRLTARSSFKYETGDDGQTEVKMTSFAGGKTDVFYFEKDRVDGRDVIRLRVGTGADAKRYIIVAVTDGEGNVSYEYLDEGQSLQDRQRLTEQDRQRDGRCSDEA